LFRNKVQYNLCLPGRNWNIP